MIPRFTATFPEPWTDVAATPSGFMQTIMAGMRLVTVVNEDNQELWRHFWKMEDDINDWLMYLTIDDSGDYIGGQGHLTDEVIVGDRDGTHRKFGPSHGQDCVRLRNGYVYVMRPPVGDHYDIISLRTGTTIAKVPCLPTSQGFRDILPDGRVILGESKFNVLINGRLLSRPNWRGALTVGQQGNRGDIIEGILEQAGFSGFTIFKAKSYEPHVAQLGDRYAICARTEKGAAFTVIEPPYPPDEFFIPPEPKPAIFPMRTWGFFGERNLWPRSSPNDIGQPNSVYDYQEYELDGEVLIVCVKFRDPSKRAFFRLENAWIRWAGDKDGIEHALPPELVKCYCLKEDFTPPEDFQQWGYAFTNGAWFPPNWDGRKFYVEDNYRVIFGSDRKEISRDKWPYARWCQWVPQFDYGRDVGIQPTLKVYRDSSEFTNPGQYEIALLTKRFGDSGFESAKGWREIWNIDAGLRIVPKAPILPFPIARPKEPKEDDEMKFSEISGHEYVQFWEWLDGMYRTELLRPDGLYIRDDKGFHPDFVGLGEWGRRYLSQRIEFNKSVGDACADVLYGKGGIKDSDEWRNKHPTDPDQNPR